MQQYYNSPWRVQNAMDNRQMYGQKPQMGDNFQRGNGDPRANPWTQPAQQNPGQPQNPFTAPQQTPQAPQAPQLSMGQGAQAPERTTIQMLQPNILPQAPWSPQMQNEISRDRSGPYDWNKPQSQGPPPGWQHPEPGQQAHAQQMPGAQQTPQQQAPQPASPQGSPQGLPQQAPPQPQQQPQYQPQAQYQQQYNQPPNVFTSAQPTPMFNEQQMRAQQNVAAAQGVPAMADLRQQFANPGMSSASPAAQYGMGAMAGMAGAQANANAAQIGNQMGWQNAQNMLQGQQLRDNEAQGWAGLANQGMQNRWNANNQRNNQMFGFLQNAYRSL